MNGKDLASRETILDLIALEEQIVGSEENPEYADSLLVRTEVDDGEQVRSIDRAYSILTYMRVALENEENLTKRFRFDEDGTPWLNCTDSYVRAFFDYL